MGCAASKIEKDEKMQICKERKKLMEDLLRFRGEFAEAQLAYLRSLRNTGVTLRQFTEPESLELENTSYGMVLHPQPPLPPPPPPPPDSPELGRVDDNYKYIPNEEIVEMERSDGCLSSSGPMPSNTRGYLDISGYSSLHFQQGCDEIEQAEDNWEQTKTEFEEKDRGQDSVSRINQNPIPKKRQPLEEIDEDTSMMSWYTKPNVGTTMIESSKRTLDSIIRALDEHFLKASAGGEKIAVLMEINRGDSSHSDSFKENLSKRYNSAKVFSALSWSWSSKSLQLARDNIEVCGCGEPCKPGAHYITLKKLHAAEQSLYQEMKEEETTKLEHERKLLLLQIQEKEDYDWTKTEKTRALVENLESDLSRLQHSISTISSSILEIIGNELYPQLVALISGLMQMWKTMNECHQDQSNIALRLSLITDCQGLDLSSEYHRQATKQLETEVNRWHNSFSKVMKSQEEYVKTLGKWTQLTECLVSDQSQRTYLLVVRRLCEDWQDAMKSLPKKEVSDAIRGLLSVTQSILSQQREEYNLRQKSDKLEARLQKQLCSLEDIKQKLGAGWAAEDTNSSLSPKNPLSIKHAKTETLKKLVENEKVKYLNLVEVSKAMTISNLKTTLPKLFQALMGLSSACTLLFESLADNGRVAVSDVEALQISTLSTCPEQDTV